MLRRHLKKHDWDTGEQDYDEKLVKNRITGAKFLLRLLNLLLLG